MGMFVKPPVIRFDTKQKILLRGKKQSQSSKFRRKFNWLLGEPADKCKHCKEYNSVWILKEEILGVIDIYMYCEKCGKIDTDVEISYKRGYK